MIGFGRSLIGGGLFQMPPPLKPSVELRLSKKNMAGFNA
jgi:hypothetical protein